MDSDVRKMRNRPRRGARGWKAFGDRSGARHRPTWINSVQRFGRTRPKLGRRSAQFRSASAQIRSKRPLGDVHCRARRVASGCGVARARCRGAGPRQAAQQPPAPPPPPPPARSASESQALVPMGVPPLGAGAPPQPRASPSTTPAFSAAGSQLAQVPPACGCSTGRGGGCATLCAVSVAERSPCKFSDCRPKCAYVHPSNSRQRGPQSIESGQIWAELESGRTRPNSGKTSIAFGANSSTIGLISFRIGQISSGLGRSRPNMGQIRPTSTEFGPTSTQSGDKSAITRPFCVGQVIKLGQNWGTFGQQAPACRPELARFRPTRRRCLSYWARCWLTLDLLG